MIPSRRIEFLPVLGVRLEADAVERQDLSALQERAPAGNRCGVRDVDLLERVRIRSAAERASAGCGNDVAMTALISCSADFRMNIASGAHLLIPGTQSEREGRGSAARFRNARRTTLSRLDRRAQVDETVYGMPS